MQLSLAIPLWVSSSRISHITWRISPVVSLMSGCGIKNGSSTMDCTFLICDNFTTIIRTMKICLQQICGSRRFNSHKMFNRCTEARYWSQRVPRLKPISTIITQTNAASARLTTVCLHTVNTMIWYSQNDYDHLHIKARYHVFTASPSSMLSWTSVPRHQTHSWRHPFLIRASKKTAQNSIL